MTMYSYGCNTVIEIIFGHDICEGDCSSAFPAVKKQVEERRVFDIA